ncbi:DUF1611 domain-containing protein [Sphingomonas sp. MMS24-J13]|uniref:DUF1611 domain-containing protein n=1 Tax=Sphingomonas sp. MMS24-J13 TaxID=3238686 RepID=UPI00384E8913
MSESDSAAARAIELPFPYLLFLGDVEDKGHAKTAFGLRDWVPEKCVAELALPAAQVSTGLPAMRPAEAKAHGARSLVIGVAASGGAIKPGWMPSLIEALEAGLDLVSGMHSRMADIPLLVETAQRLGRKLIDIRVPPANLPVGTGLKRSGRRLLTVGTDCALGKKYTALALARGIAARGVACDFRATGQTGIMIAGGGMPMDAVVADFEAGAAEVLSPAAADDHWDVIEGQGLLFHPSFAAVSLGLLHGSQPDVIVVCHEPGRHRMLGSEDFATPSIEEAIELNLRLGSRTNPTIRCGGVSLNTSELSADEAEAMIAAESKRLGLPVADPVRGGAAFERLVDCCLS